jgi:hypothetical protein
VRTIAEGFVLRLAAAAKADYRSASQPELLTLRVENLEIPFNPY